MLALVDQLQALDISVQVFKNGGVLILDFKRFFVE